MASGEIDLPRVIKGRGPSAFPHAEKKMCSQMDLVIIMDTNSIPSDKKQICRRKCVTDVKEDHHKNACIIEESRSRTARPTDQLLPDQKNETLCPQLVFYGNNFKVRRGGNSKNGSYAMHMFRWARQTSTEAIQNCLQWIKSVSCDLMKFKRALSEGLRRISFWGDAGRNWHSSLNLPITCAIIWWFMPSHCLILLEIISAVFEKSFSFLKMSNFIQDLETQYAK